MNAVMIPQESLMPGYKAETRIVKVEAIPNYYKVGNGTMNKHGLQSIDLLDEVIKSNKAEQYVIQLLKDLTTYDSPDGVVVIPTHQMTETQKRSFRKGYKTLRERGLVRRVKRGEYMINPNALILNSYKQSMIEWNKYIVL